MSYVISMNYVASMNQKRLIGGINPPLIEEDESTAHFGIYRLIKAEIGGKSGLTNLRFNESTKKQISKNMDRRVSESANQRVGEQTNGKLNKIMNQGINDSASRRGKSGMWNLYQFLVKSSAISQRRSARCGWQISPARCSNADLACP